jgi:hypothetical protein
MKSWLTIQEQKFLVCLIFLLLTGMAVKAYRSAHPRRAGGQVEKYAPAVNAELDR